MTSKKHQSYLICIHILYINTLQKPYFPTGGQLTQQLAKLMSINFCIFLAALILSGFSNDFDKGQFKYYFIKEVGGWGQKTAIFDDLQYCKSSKRWVCRPKRVKNMTQWKVYVLSIFHFRYWQKT